MTNSRLTADVRNSATLPADFYRSADIYDQSLESVFASTWHLAGDTRELESSGRLIPKLLMEGSLDEPILLSRDKEDNIHVLSNVCTHRGNLLVSDSCRAASIRCSYHGRRFGLDGKFEFMPEFKEAENFPTEDDSLPKVPFAIWRDKFIFASPIPAYDINEAFAFMDEKISFLPLKEFIFDPLRSRDYLVKAHWALYCDNYLEGLHIPFIHPDLTKTFDFAKYEYHLGGHINLQTGIGSSGDFCFDLPEGHPDHGKQISAYYFWLFPNTMFNFYPWGLSVNIVKPLRHNLTKVSFLSYVYDDSKSDSGSGSILDKVEREDEAVVETVQRGIQSRFYKAGRFSPSAEKGVHHFHLLMDKFMNRNGKVI